MHCCLVLLIVGVVCCLHVVVYCLFCVVVCCFACVVSCVLLVDGVVVGGLCLSFVACLCVLVV